MGLYDVAWNLMLDDLAARARFASLHTADAELPGRQPITWRPASDSALKNASNPTFDVPAGSKINLLKFWSAADGGVAYGDAEIVEEEFVGAGTYTVDGIVIALPV